MVVDVDDDDLFMVISVIIIVVVDVECCCEILKMIMHIRCLLKCLSENIICECK